MGATAVGVAWIVFGLGWAFAWLRKRPEGTTLADAVVRLVAPVGLMLVAGAACLAGHLGASFLLFLAAVVADKVLEGLGVGLARLADESVS